MQKPNNTRKMEACTFRGLRVKEGAMNRQKNRKESFVFVS